MRPIFLFSLFSIVLFSCKSQQYTLDTLPEKQLVFGRGGGISGEVTTYVVLENGQVFYNNSLTKEHTEIENIGKKEAMTCFRKMDSLRLSEMNFDHPGNMYYFLEEVNGEERYRVTWGSKDHEVSRECKDFYKELRTTIK
ncbi:hypothetical protein [Maribacter sp. 2308TA10-17]|uniref:hypothetical protein n=1 Tax=Maribacter sp. 2308TA10-17 TaxID=3386276 RepID=UPI0039BC65DB